MHRALLTGAVVSAAVVVGLPSTAAAAEQLTVCASGCDHTTIAAAVEAAAAGDTVVITEDQTVSAAVPVSRDITITGAEGVVLTRTGASANVFAIGPAGDGATISALEITSATVVSGAFITVNGADDVTIEGNTIYGPEQTGSMSTWVVNRAWTSNAVSGLAILDNTMHTMRTGGYIDGGSGVVSGNATWNTKGDYLLGEQADFAITGNSAGDPDRPSEWGVVIFEENETAYDVDALGAANDCLTVWDQATDETFVDGDCDGIDDTPPPAAKDECRKGGWATFNNPSFRTQGQCVSAVAKQK